MLKKNDKRDHAWEVDHGSIILGTTTYGEIQTAKEGPAYGVHDLEKACDKTPRNVMWWALEKHKVPAKYITFIKDMYDNVVTSVRTSDVDTDDFPIKI